MRADLYGWNDQFESEYTMHMATEPDSGNRRMLEIWITSRYGMISTEVASIYRCKQVARLYMNCVL